MSRKDRCKRVSHPRETEIKLQLPSANTARLRSVPLLRRGSGSKRSEQLVSVYFDTKGLKLKRSGLTLRVRHAGDRYFQTIKSDDGGLFDRGEWEAELRDGRPDLKQAAAALKPLGLKKLSRQLRPVFETRVQRTTYPLTRKDCDIELAIDRGEIDAEGHEMPPRGPYYRDFRGAPGGGPRGGPGADRYSGAQGDESGSDGGVEVRMKLSAVSGQPSA